MIVLKINGKAHYINMGLVIEIFEDEWTSSLTNEKISVLKIRLNDGTVLCISNKEEQEDLCHFLEGNFDGGEA